MSGNVAAILLAAGRSSRMGSCKQLLTLGEDTVTGRCLDTLVMAGVGDVVVVISEEWREVAEVVRAYPARVVVNPEYEGDMASSVRAGRDALTDEATGVIVFPCDYPLVSAVTIASLIAEHGESPGSIIIPCHGEQRGHPLLFPREMLDELANGMILRDIVRRDPDRIRFLDVDDPGVLIDMDTPEDYQRICGLLQPA